MKTRLARFLSLLILALGCSCGAPPAQQPKALQNNPDVTAKAAKVTVHALSKVIGGAVCMPPPGGSQDSGCGINSDPVAFAGNFLVTSADGSFSQTVTTVESTGLSETIEVPAGVTYTVTYFHPAGAAYLPEESTPATVKPAAGDAQTVEMLVTFMAP